MNAFMTSWMYTFIQLPRLQNVIEDVTLLQLLSNGLNPTLQVAAAVPCCQDISAACEHNIQSAAAGGRAAPRLNHVPPGTPGRQEKGQKWAECSVLQCNVVHCGRHTLIPTPFNDIFKQESECCVLCIELHDEVWSTGCNSRWVYYNPSQRWESRQGEEGSFGQARAQIKREASSEVHEGSPAAQTGSHHRGNTVTERSIPSFARILCFRGFTASAFCLLVSSHPLVCLKNGWRRATEILANVYAKKLSKHPERKPAKYKNSSAFLISLYLYACPLDFTKEDKFN